LDGSTKLHWTFCTSDIKNPKKPAGDLGSAFAVRGEKEVAYTDPEFIPYEYNATSKLYNGFTMTYTSKEVDTNCAEADKKSQIKFMVKCKQENDKEPKFVFKQNDKCIYQAEIEHQAGCALDLSVLLGVQKFIGIIAIVTGLALTFAGSKFVAIVIGFLTGTVVFFLCFLVGAVVIKGTPALIGFAVVGLILGGLAGYYSGKFVEDYGV
jgi:hypothetical protein